MANQGVAFLAFLAQIFTEKLLWQNFFFFKFLFHKDEIAEKGQYKKKSFALLFYNVFPEYLSCFFRYV